MMHSMGWDWRRIPGLTGEGGRRWGRIPPPTRRAWRNTVNAVALGATGVPLLQGIHPLRVRVPSPALTIGLPWAFASLTPSPRVADGR